MTIFDLLKEVTVALEKRSIPYMVSGSMAMLVYTVSRTTRDIDIVIELSEESVEEFCEIFKTNFHLHKPTVQEELRRRGMFNAIDHRSGMKIDFVIRKNNLYRRTEFERKRRDFLFGQEMWVVAIEDLILSKLIWIQDVKSERQMEALRVYSSILTMSII
jgi:hypothetical protein